LLLYEPVYFVRFPINLTPRESHRVGAAKTGPAEQQVREQILIRGLAQFRELLAAERLCSMLRVTTGTAIETHGVLGDHLAFNADAKHLMEPPKRLPALS
jgi:hypothetical protein